jgi:ketosteroid isomerase-like protein
MRIATTLVALAATALVATPAHADDDSAARAVEEAFAKASQLTDATAAVQGISAVFTDDMDHIGIFGRVHGKAQLTQLLTGAFAAGQRVPATYKSHETIPLDGRHLVDIAHFDAVGPGPDGKPAQLKLRCTRTLERGKDGTWRILAEHTSVGVPLPPPPSHK